MHTTDAIARHGHTAVFVVTVWRNPATELMSDREARLREAGAVHVTSFVTLSWKYAEALLPYYSMDLPHRALEVRDDIRRGFDLLADEASRREFVAHLRLRLHADFGGLPAPVSEPQYFPRDLFRVRDDEAFVDCGAFDGDTLKSLLRAAPSFAGRVAAFEPDRANFAKLAAWRDSLSSPLREGISVFPLGVGARKEQVSFADGGGSGSAIGSGDVVIDVAALDQQLPDWQPSFIKVDVEGYEPDVLTGARGLIERSAPILALSAYHRQDHLWQLPLMAASMHSGYSFTLRSYYLDGWELVLYAVPRGRRLDLV
jgi:FkbM family methyltransferase